MIIARGSESKQRKTKHNMTRMMKEKKTLKLNQKTDILLPRTADRTAKKKVDNGVAKEHDQINLRKLMICQEDGRCTNAFKLIASKTVLLAAY